VSGCTRPPTSTSPPSPRSTPTTPSGQSTLSCRLSSEPRPWHCRTSLHATPQTPRPRIPPGSRRANRSELNAAVAVADKPGDVFTSPVFRRQRHRQRVPGQRLAHMVRHLPADDLAVEQIKDERRVHPLSLRRDIRNIGDPDPIRIRCCERVFDEIVRTLLSPG